MTINCPPRYKVVGGECPQVFAVSSFVEGPSGCTVTGDSIEIGEFDGRGASLADGDSDAESLRGTSFRRRHSQVVIAVTPIAPIPKPHTLINAIQGLTAPFHLGFRLPLSAVPHFSLFTFLSRFTVRRPRCVAIIMIGDRVRARRRQNMLSSSTAARTE